MRLRGKAAITVSVGALLAGLSGPALTSPASAQAIVLIHPDVLHVGHSSRQPPTTADCESTFGVACYEPAQIQQAYNLPVLYAKGVNGRGATIVIVDSFGSPAIVSDLAAFDGQFGLPAPPSFRIIRPAGAVPPYNPSDSLMGS